MLTPQSDTACGRTRVSVVLIAPEEQRRRTIARVISGTQARIVDELGEYPTFTIASKLAGSGCDVIIVDLDGGVEPGLVLIETISRLDVSLTVMACSSGNEADLVIRAMQAGAREFFAASPAAATLIEAFSRAASRRQTAGRERVQGKVLVFQGSKGGAGLTTLATNFAVSLNTQNGGGVVLVDLHPQLGEIALGLGIAPRFSVADALENAVRLDADFLATMLVRHKSGLMLLTSPDTYGAHRSLERGSEKLFRILREAFAYVVVDAGACSGNTPDAVFEIADTVYLVTEVNLPALRNARRLISYFAARESTRGLEVVLNRFNSRAVEIDEESVVKALSRPIDWKIPNDYMAVRGAQNLGVPLIEHDSPIARAIAGMARAATGKPVNVHERKAAAGVKVDKWKFWTSNNIRPLSTARS
jgi:pilus assembly protein CpaE